MSAHARKADLDAALSALPGGIGAAVNYVRAAPLMAEIVRDVAAYADVLPEEITENVKAAIDLLNGGDGVIYR